MSKPQTPTSMGMISGEHVDIFDMTPGEVKAWDIAWGLSKQCRYNGQIPVTWDVLSHTALCIALYKNECTKTNATPTNGMLMAIALHDAAEAYCGDLIRPLKSYFTEFAEIEERVARIIYQRFKMNYDAVDWTEVKRWDNEALWTEQATFGRNNDLVYGNPNFNKNTMLALQPCAPVQYIEFLRDLCVQEDVPGVSTLFTLPDIIKPYLTAYPKRGADERRDDSPSVNDILNLT